jgi:hypothetical protein
MNTSICCRTFEGIQHTHSKTQARTEVMDGVNTLRCRSGNCS